MSALLVLDALKDHVNQACVAGQSAPAPHTIPRVVSVVNREVKDYWQGSYPLVETLAGPRSIISMTGSTYSPMAQDFGHPAIYMVRITSQTNPDAGIDVDAVQTELLCVMEAIEVWFSHVPHRCLPDGSGNARVQYAGPPLLMRPNLAGLYAQPNNTLGQVLAFSLTVLELSRDVSST